MMNVIRIGLSMVAIGAFILMGYGIYIINMPLIATIAFAIIETGLAFTVFTIILKEQK